MLNFYFRNYICGQISNTFFLDIDIKYVKINQNMNDDKIDDVIETLEIKYKDCTSFSNKYKLRKMDDLFQYYEGAKWALDYALATIRESKNGKAL